ncbi:MAG: chorismate lyase [Candidatus Competibacteraceae bacterium]
MSIIVHHFRLFSEPRWLPRAHLHQGELPAGLAAWLFDPGSLTRRVRQVCPGVFRVQVLDQTWARPLPSEADLLAVSHRQYVWVREVQLFCDTQAWVFARTVMPPVTLQGRGRRLQHLGTRPLGEVLFTDPKAKRSEVEIARIMPNQRLHQRAFGRLAEAPTEIWGRRSLFRIDGRPLLVYEVFLPSLPLSCPSDKALLTNSSDKGSVLQSHELDTSRKSSA